MRLSALIHHAYDRLEPELEALAEALAPYSVRLECDAFPDLTAPLPQADAYFAQGLSRYHESYPAFLTLLERLEQSGKPCLNPPALMRWNSEKSYLRELEAEGIRILPTLWVDPASSGAEEWRKAAEAQGWQEAVVKPTISAGAQHTARLSVANEEAWRAFATDLPPGKRLMIQAFAPEIIAEGEWSFLFFGDAFSHAVLKTAKAKDYRIQHVHGGSYHHIAPPPAALLQDAEAALHALPPGAIYARVDGIRRGGRLWVMEIELIEPFLYMLPEQQAVSNAAAAMAQALGAASELKRIQA